MPGISEFSFKAGQYFYGMLFLNCTRIHSLAYYKHLILNYGQPLLIFILKSNEIHLEMNTILFSHLLLSGFYVQRFKKCLRRVNLG